MNWRWRTILLVTLLTGIAVFMRSAGVSPKSPQQPGYTQLLEAEELLVAHDVDSPRRNDLSRAAWNSAFALANDRGIDNSLLPQPTDTDSYHNAIRRLIRQSKGKLEEGDLIKAAITGMAASLNDPHTAYIGTATWNDTKNGVSKRFTPAYLFQTTRTPEGALVWQVTPDSQAIQDGIRVLDTIVELNGQSLNGQSTGSFSSKTPNHLTVMRPGVGEIKLVVRPEPERARPFETRIIERVAYFRLYAMPPLEFHVAKRAFRSDLLQAIQSLAAEHPEGWIIDLRGNPGGYTDTLLVVAGSLGFNGRSATDIGRGVVVGAFSAQGPNLIGPAPLVVLTNERTASAAEILAANLQQNGAEVIGTQTAGSVRAAQAFPLRRGGALQISVATTQVGANFTDLDKVGVTPDDLLRFDPAQARLGHDNQLERGLRWLHQVPGAGRSRAP